MTTLAAGDLGATWACALFLRAEREYWIAQCNVAAVQSVRLENAGVGWSVADHYTFCSSRALAPYAAAVLQSLGFERRGALFNGRRCGALVLEQPMLRVIALIEFDQEAAARDDAMVDLPWRHEAGLWAAMHGESMLEGGLRYVAFRCDVARWRGRLLSDGFSVEADDETGPRHVIARCPRRAVGPRRIDELERQGHLSEAQAEDSRLNGGFMPFIMGVECADASAMPNLVPFDGPEASADPAVIASSAPRRRTKLRNLQR